MELKLLGCFPAASVSCWMQWPGSHVSADAEEGILLLYPAWSRRLMENEFACMRLLH